MDRAPPKQADEPMVEAEFWSTAAPAPALPVPAPPRHLRPSPFPSRHRRRPRR
nr:hypothetical protein [Delftia lacustris]